MVWDKVIGLAGTGTKDTRESVDPKSMLVSILIEPEETLRGHQGAEGKPPSPTGKELVVKIQNLLMLAERTRRPLGLALIGSGPLGDGVSALFLLGCMLGGLIGGSLRI